MLLFYPDQEIQRLTVDWITACSSVTISSYRLLPTEIVISIYLDIRHNIGWKLFVTKGVCCHVIIVYFLELNVRMCLWNTVYHVKNVGIISENLYTLLFWEYNIFMNISRESVMLLFNVEYKETLYTISILPARSIRVQVLLSTAHYQITLKYALKSVLTVITTL